MLGVMRTAAFRSAVFLAAALVLAPLAARAQDAPKPDLGSDEERAHGEEVYAKWCAQCHGDKGDGQGIAAPRLLPPPRDFTAGKYKFRSTPFGALPLDADLHRSIRVGLPGSGMPAFQELSEDEVHDVIQYLKTFADDWQDPAAYAEAVALPDPPAFSAESAEAGAQAYVEIGCARCHGDEGRGDGRSAPTLRDDWGHFIRVADLTQPWTFRGGATREDVFRTITTGVYGTPMAAFGDALSEEQRWAIVDWIVAQAGGDGDGAVEAPYGRLVTAHPVDGDIVLPDDPAKVREPFADAPATWFPIVGQVMQPGRDFHPAARNVEVRAIFNRDDIAFLVSWHDMSAETSGENAPDLPVPPFADQQAAGTGAGAGGAAGEELGGAAANGGGSGDFWGTGGDAGGDAGTDQGAQAAGGGGDFWGSGDSGGGNPGGGNPGGGEQGGSVADVFGSAETQPAAPASPWSDAVALQFPAELRPGVAKPYFLFGDPSYPVELWHVDLAHPEQAVLWEGRGSAQLTRLDRTAPQVVAHYEAGRWSVAFKRPRSGAGNLAFAEDEFVPLAATVWDGFQEERGNRRGLTAWYHVYLPPLETPSPAGPMVRAGLGVLALELLVVLWARRRYGRGPTVSDPTSVPPSEPLAGPPAATQPRNR